MIELPLIFVGGLLGSAHCLGMCGPLAIALGASSGGRPVRRQLVFSAGRLFTYSCFGAAAGFGGRWIASQSRDFVLAQAWLAVAAGILLLLTGLATAGVLPRPTTRMLSTAPCGAASWVAAFLRTPGWPAALLAGVFTGFIPCGLVYAFLLKAGSAGNLWLGGLTMAVFGLGTAPLLVAAGFGGQLLSSTARARLFRIAAWCIVVTGAISVVRGAGQINAPVESVTSDCPFCNPT